MNLNQIQQHLLISWFQAISSTFTPQNASHHHHIRPKTTLWLTKKNTKCVWRTSNLQDVQVIQISVIIGDFYTNLWFFGLLVLNLNTSSLVVFLCYVICMYCATSIVGKILCYIFLLELLFSVELYKLVLGWQGVWLLIFMCLLIFWAFHDWRWNCKMNAHAHILWLFAKATCSCCYGHLNILNMLSTPSHLSSNCGEVKFAKIKWPENNFHFKNTKCNGCTHKWF